MPLFGQHFLQKLCLSAKFPDQEIRWNYGIFCSVCCFYDSFSAEKYFVCHYIALCEKCNWEKATKCSWKTIKVLLDAVGHVATKVGYFFFKKFFCLMSGLKFTLSDVTSFLPDNLLVLQKNHIQVSLNWIGFLILS